MESHPAPFYESLESYPVGLPPHQTYRLIYPIFDSSLSFLAIYDITNRRLLSPPATLNTCCIAQQSLFSASIPLHRHSATCSNIHLQSPPRQHQSSTLGSTTTIKHHRRVTVQLQSSCNRLVRTRISKYLKKKGKRTRFWTSELPFRAEVGKHKVKS